MVVGQDKLPKGQLVINIKERKDIKRYQGRYTLSKTRYAIKVNYLLKPCKTTKNISPMVSNSMGV